MNKAAACDAALLTRIITIDGPAGAGKSSVAQNVARRLGFAYLDTGAMYRAATWWALQHGIGPHDTAGLIRSTQTMPLEIDWDGSQFHVRVNSRDVSENIRTPEVTDQIKMLSGIPEVRAHLVQLQREFAADRPIVTEGRDQGSVVFPNARCKLYLEASLDERARRRADQYAKTAAAQIDAAALREAIAKRDEADSARQTAPLTRPDDAIVVDTTNLSIEQVIERVIAIARERIPEIGH